MRRNKVLMPLFFIVFFGGTMIAQIPNTRDSLVMYLKTAPKDSNYVWALNRYANKLLNETDEYDKVDSVLKIAEPLALKYNYILGKYANTRVRATMYYYKTDYAKALAYFQKAVEEATRFQLPGSILYEAYSNVVTLHNSLNNYDEALKMSFKCLEMQEKYKLKPYASIYAAIGDALKALQRPKEALAYVKKAIVIDNEQKNWKNAAIHNNSLGNIYDDLSQPKEALKYFKLALSLAKKAEFLRGQTDYLANTGRMYQQLKQPKEAIRYMEQSLQLAEQLEAVTSVAVAKSNLASVYREIDQPERAEAYLKEALALAKKQNDAVSIAEYQESLSALYADNQSFKKAYQNLLESTNLGDSTEKVATAQQLQELIAKYETKAKEQQIRLLQQESKIKDQELLQNRLWLIGGGLALLLALVSIVFVINRAKYRRLQESLQLRNKIAADLHDEIGSTLSSISLLSGLTQKQLAANQPQKAEQMVGKISADARQMLESMDDIVWTINPRNDSMQHLFTRLREYAKPLAESKEITLDFVTDAQVEALSLPLQVRQNVYLIVKEALNNAFKYAQASQINVEFRGQSDEWNVAVIDNGVGFDTEAVSSRNGLKNMKKRAEEIGANLLIESELQKGSEIRLNFKN
ncbi:hypothetical protein DTQ70_26905 [Runella sp. SP2]|nr:hypothetical protein DTQ70_26905 [Runella sp. SP2]